MNFPGEGQLQAVKRVRQSSADADDFDGILPAPKRRRSQKAATPAVPLPTNADGTPVDMRLLAL